MGTECRVNLLQKSKVTQAHKMGAAIDEGLQLVRHQETPIDVLRMPIQHLKRVLSEFAARSRTLAVAGTRMDNTGTVELDIMRSRGGLDDPKAANHFSMIQCGATWTNVFLQHSGDIDTDLCSFCQARHTVTHILWECQAHAQLRRSTDAGLADLDHTLLPEAIKIGLAPALSGGIGDTFRGEHGSKFLESMRKALGAHHGQHLSAQENDYIDAWKPSGDLRQLCAALKCTVWWPFWVSLHSNFGPHLCCSCFQHTSSVALGAVDQLVATTLAHTLSSDSVSLGAALLSTIALASLGLASRNS